MVFNNLSYFTIYFSYIDSLFSLFFVNLLLHLLYHFSFSSLCFFLGVGFFFLILVCLLLCSVLRCTDQNCKHIKNMGGARCPQWQNYFLGFAATVLPNDTQHFMTGVASFSQSCKELLLMTPLASPLMKTVLNTASGKQSLGYSSLDTEFHNDPRGSSPARVLCTVPGLAFGVPYGQYGTWQSEKGPAIIHTLHSLNHWHRCSLTLVLTVIFRVSWCSLPMFINALYHKIFFNSIHCLLGFFQF